MICSRCKRKIIAGDYAVGCTKCGKSYHTRCWVINRGCVTSFCKGKPSPQFMMGENNNSDIIPERHTINEDGRRIQNENSFESIDLTLDANPLPQTFPTPVPEPNTDEDRRERICPYCQTSIEPNEDMIICEKCHIPHHRACWSENGSCTTYGCDGRRGMRESGTPINNTSYGPDSGDIQRFPQPTTRHERQNRRERRRPEYTRFPRYPGWGHYDNDWSSARVVISIIAAIIYVLIRLGGCVPP